MAVDGGMRQERANWTKTTMLSRAALFALLASAGCSGNVGLAGASLQGGLPVDDVKATAPAAEPTPPPPSGAQTDAPVQPSTTNPSDRSTKSKPARGTSSSTSTSASASTAAKTCSDLATEAKGTLTQNCATCHSGSGHEGGFSVVLDVPSMIEQTKIVPKDHAASKLFAMVDSGLMPRGAQKLAQNLIDDLASWIDCGAPDWNAPAPSDPALGFVDIDARLHTLRDDLGSLSSDDVRRRTRYIDLSALANAGRTKDEIEVYRHAVAFLVNSLSFEGKVTLPQDVGSDGLFIRLDLNDYGWSGATWEQIAAVYPYAVRYGTGSSRRAGAGFDEDAGQALRDSTGTDVPVIQADWFLSHASRPPLYYTVLGIDADIRNLTAALGVDVAADIAAGRVARAGFNRSGVSVNNRVIERHDKGDKSGAFWISYDFRSNTGFQNIFAHPTDFQQNGGEGIFHLPNGLQGYFILNDAFTRLDKAPTDIVTDPNSKDRAVEAGLSCMGGCHLNRGIILKDDTVRDYVLNTPAAAALLTDTLRLYPETATMHDLIDNDNKRYLAAFAVTGFQSTDENALNELVRAHEDLLDSEKVAAVLGLTLDAFNKAVDDHAADVPLEVAALRQPGGTMFRDVLDTEFGDVVHALGLGERVQLQVNAGNNNAGN